MLLRLALRNIWRNRRRSLLTLSAMVVSASLLILALGVFSGMLADILASATEQYQGHLVIARSGYQDDHDLFANFSPTDQTLESLRADPAVLGATPRLRGFGLVSHRQATYPAELLGIEAAAERQVTTLAGRLSSGRYLDSGEKDGALIGTGLAARLGVKPGDELVFVTQAADGSIGNDLLRVKGIFATGDSSHDNGLVLVNLGWLQRLMVLPGKVHEIAVRLADPMAAASVAARINRWLPADLSAVGWETLLPEMKEVIASFDVSRMIIVIILYLATGLGILNTFFMSVLERTREFGVLMAIGMRPWKIRALVLIETLVMGVFALVAGVSLGLLMSLYMARYGIDLSATMTPITYAGGTLPPRLHAVIVASNVLLPAWLLLVVCLLAGFLPANRAAKLKVVEALRED
ncbi:ABC transporter permease [Desulfuromonas carbonis]|uniref:ABC transporter permease n=1 Tax=Desulfuromonas sp. DDH964 TaxID=1823759 RepID=UPI00078C6864|nr:FtsX-like permease family protein [Desulfuromonas sp. DDH964]AMV72809.1 lipoprotein release ABC transporter membrane protein [Desulfuromonas sp. DDH964]